MSFSAQRDEHYLVEAAATLDRTLDAPLRERLASYAELVSTWNARVNLTGARDAAALVDVLFADALVLSDEALVPRGAHIVDVGAGAGAPSLPLAILREDVEVTLVEPRRLRVGFLHAAVGALDLGARVRVAKRRIEGPPLSGVPFDVALSRATFEPREWLARGLALSSRVLVLTGADPLPEGDATLSVTRSYRLPFGGAARAVGLYVRS